MKTRDEIQSWLRERIATEGNIKPEDISLDTPFPNYGLDSIVIVTLVDDLEDYLGASLDPTIFWEYPTIKALTDWFLSEDYSKR